MLKTIITTVIEMFKSVFMNPVIQNDLEAYIVAGNPQNAGDVERLEREFSQLRQSLTRYSNY
jgi:hypothetical protein